MYYSDLKDFLEIINKIKDCKIFIVGAGTNGVLLGNFFNKNHISYEGYVDKKNIQDVEGKKVLSYKSINPSFKYYYIISSFINRNEMYKALKEQGISDDYIIDTANRNFSVAIYEQIFDVHKYINRIKNFKNKYLGQRCFIIGNGPSLMISDLNNLLKEKTFACNTIWPVYDHTKWRPFFYCVQDPCECSVIIKDNTLLKMLLDNCSFFFTNIRSKIALKCRDLELQKMFFYRGRVMADGEKEFSDNAYEVLFISGTITFIMIQLAVYMGFKDIYLLGIDFSFTQEHHDDGSITSNDVDNHNSLIEEEEEKLRISDEIQNMYGSGYFVDYDKQLRGYQAAKKYADTHGIKIYNATRGGKLEVFPRVDFDSLFEKS